MLFKKLRDIGLMLGLGLFAAQALAFPCFITMVKGSCWKGYTVVVDVLDAENDKVLMTITIPNGELWSRQAFEASPKQRFMLRATFSPSFWHASKGTQYYAKRYWSLPETVEGETVAWNVGACYPSDFSSVPMPPDAGSNCACDTREIPQVKPDEAYGLEGS